MTEGVSRLLKTVRCYFSVQEQEDSIEARRDIQASDGQRLDPFAYEGGQECFQQKACSSSGRRRAWCPSPPAICSAHELLKTHILRMCEFIMHHYNIVKTHTARSILYEEIQNSIFLMLYYLRLNYF